MRNLQKFYIDGARVNPSSKRTLPLIDPATEEHIEDVPLGTERDVGTAVGAASRAIGAYSHSTREERLQLLRRLLDAYNDHYDELARLMTREMGTPLRFSNSAQTLMGRIHLESGIEALRAFVFDEPRGDALIAREPIGVCGLITPWNWPMHQLMLKIVPALAAGCTVVVKPSECSPLSAVWIAELVDRVGFPAGVYNYAQGLGHEAGAAISRHPDVHMVSMTGSTRAGVAVARDAAESVKRVQQELGDKSPNILLPDADFAALVSDGVNRCFANCGQACSAASRMLVAHDRMVEAERVAATCANAFRVGPPLDDNTDTIIGYKDENEAAEIANETPYGLAAYVQTPDLDRARRRARRLRSGSVFINQATYEPTAPFGGYKLSGNGREGGEYGLAEYLEVKTIGGFGAGN